MDFSIDLPVTGIGPHLPESGRAQFIPECLIRPLVTGLSVTAHWHIIAAQIGIGASNIGQNASWLA